MSERQFEVAPTCHAAYHTWQDGIGQWRWYFVAGDGRRIAESGEFFASRDDCEKAIELFRALSESPTVHDRPREVVPYS